MYRNSMINIFTTEIRTHLAQTRPDTMQTRLLVSKKKSKWLKRGYSDRGYSDHYCKGPLYSMHLFGFIFTVLYIQLSFLLPQEQVYSGLIDC